MEQSQFDRCPEGWIEEFWLDRKPDRKTRFVIPLTLEDAATRTCGVCGGRTHKQYMRYDTPFRDGNELVVARSDTVPGWTCTRCGIESYDSEASRLALEAVREIVQRAGDTTTLTRIDETLAARSNDP